MTKITNSILKRKHIMQFSKSLFAITSALILSSVTAWAGPTAYPAGSIQEAAQIQTWKAEIDAKYDATEAAKQQALEDLLSRIEAGEFDVVDRDLVAQSTSNDKNTETK